AEPIFPPQPYSYAYDSPNLGGHHGHEESGDGSGRVSGRYFLSDADGRVRTVTYVADEFGFRADVVTNEPGTESRSPADTTFTSSALPGPDAAAAFESTRLGGPGAPTPYSYKHETTGEDGAVTVHEESGDGQGRVSGSYSFSLPDGRQRTVRYTADETGFHPELTTNEQGTESNSPADSSFSSSALPGPDAA
ncbi:unnamed protein product, partial [Ixodes persulcatus]